MEMALKEAKGVIEGAVEAKKVEVVLAEGTSGVGKAAAV